MENMGECFLTSGFLFGGMVAPVFVAVAYYPADVPQQMIVGDGV